MEIATERAAKPTHGRSAEELRPLGFQPGRSGNPAGNRLLKDQADAIFATMSGDLGPLSPTDEILLRQATLMLAKASRIPGRDRQSVDVAVRLHSEARRTITALRRRVERSKRSEEPVLSQVLAARYGAAPAVGAPENVPPPFEAAGGEDRTGGLPEAGNDEARTQ